MSLVLIADRLLSAQGYLYLSTEVAIVEQIADLVASHELLEVSRRIEVPDVRDQPKRLEDVGFPGVGLANQDVDPSAA